MKRPITILCITDLHLQGDPNEQSSAKTVTDGPLELLRDNLFHFQDDRSDQNKWAPDFLLIAGDLVDKCTRSNYKYVQRQIDALITDDNNEIAPIEKSNLPEFRFNERANVVNITVAVARKNKIQFPSDSKNTTPFL